MRMSPLMISSPASFAPAQPSPVKRRATTGLAILALGVLAVHAWLLTTTPSHISPSRGPATGAANPSPLTPAMETRRIEPPPPTPAAPEIRAVAPAPKPPRKPALKQKRAVAPEILAQAATVLIASVSELR